MEKIYSDKHYVFYGHIALYDTEDSNSYPVFEVDETKDIIFCTKGVAVTILSDTEFEVIIYRSQKKIEDINPISGEIEFISGEIEVGNRGLTVGNIAIGNIEHHIPCPSGKIWVSVSIDNPLKEEDSTIVTFIIYEYNV